MSSLSELENWYVSQCDGDWEHGSSIKIQTLDNPGWSVSINLRETNLEFEEFEPVSKDFSETNWIRCWKDKGSFQGRGGPQNLKDILSIFAEFAL